LSNWRNQYAAATRLMIPPPIVSWCESAISMDSDPTAATTGLVTIRPYQVEPIEAQFADDCREVVIMAVEQTGKSFCWRLPVVYRMLFDPGPGWIVYESDEKAEDINAEQLHPLVEAIPELAAMLNRKSSIKRRYSLPNGTIIDFSGAGADITSKARKFGVCDELDNWNMPSSSRRQNLRNFRKRFRTFWRQGVGCLTIVSSPKLADSPIHDEHDAGSQGYWHLRCDGCKSLSMPSHKVRFLQWTMSDDALLPESLRLVCPECDHEHAEARAVAMNAAGAYVHRRPHEMQKRAFQWGALAAPEVFGWSDIARAQLAAGRSAEARVQVDFDNSWRGIRFQERRENRESMDVISDHCRAEPDPDTIAGVLFSADTQDNGWYWIARGVDCAGETYLLGHGFARVWGELMAAWDADYIGIRPLAGIIDEGGHRATEMRPLLADVAGLYTYKGNSRIGARYKVSKEDPFLLLANPAVYQGELLYYIYQKRAGGVWHLPAELDDVYTAQIASVQPNRKVKHGDRYENWEPVGDDHLFDCEKMLLVLFEHAREAFAADLWRRAPGWMEQIEELPAPAVEFNG